MRTLCQIQPLTELLVGGVGLKQCFPALGTQMFLDYNSQKSWPTQLVVEGPVSFSPRTSGDPRLGTSGLKRVSDWPVRPVHVEPLLDAEGSLLGEGREIQKRPQV